MQSKREYFQECWKHAHGHWLATVIGFAVVLYSALTTWESVVVLPEWARPETWPKLPLSWALLVVSLALFWIVLEGGHRLRISRDAEHARERLAFEQIGGPELFIGYDRAQAGYSHLVIVNIKGGNAYNVVLKVPEDGSKIISKEMNILKDDGSQNFIPVGPKNSVDAADVIMAGANDSPFFVTCMDADCRVFVYHFAPPEKRSSAFKLKSKSCVGRARRTSPVPHT